jgi:hypothetical protein
MAITIDIVWVQPVLANSSDFAVVPLLDTLIPILITTPTPTPHVRKNVYTLNAAEIMSLKQGVAAMKARPDSDPTSWVYQAKMHGINPGSPAPAALQRNCQHRQFFFFSWHRMYIYYFERILRKASGDPNLTLPYWNYTDNWPTQAAIPEAYRIPANATNPLYNNTRNPIYNSGANLPQANVQYNIAFNATNFTIGTLGATSFGGLTVSQPAHLPSFLGSGLLERSPHNNVHNDISGDMASLESPRDPVFILHHANIDRLWNRWIAQGNGRENPTNNSTWMNQEFFFFDEDGNQVALKGSQILNTVAQLNYRYDDDPVTLPRVALREAQMSQQKVIASEILTTQKQPIKLTEKRQEVNITIPEDNRSTLLQSIQSKFANERIILQIKGIQYDEPVGMTYLLFINLPESVRNPDHTDPHFIGTLSFFGKADSSGSDHHGTLAEFTEDYDITQVLQGLQSTANISLTIIPSYPTAPADRKDLQEMIAQMRPQGNPRFDEVVVLKFRVE